MAKMKTSLIVAIFALVILVASYQQCEKDST